MSDKFLRPVAHVVPLMYAIDHDFDAPDDEHDLGDWYKVEGWPGPERLSLFLLEERRKARPVGCEVVYVFDIPITALYFRDGSMWTVEFGLTESRSEHDLKALR